MNVARCPAAGECHGYILQRNVANAVVWKAADNYAGREKQPALRSHGGCDVANDYIGNSPGHQRFLAGMKGGKPSAEPNENGHVHIGHLDMVKSNIVDMSTIDRHNLDPTESAVDEFAMGAVDIGEGTA